MGADVSVGMRVQRLPEESELAIRGQFRALLAWWGLTVEEVKVLISDGASWYQAALDWVRKAQQQRSIFHLWRNILPTIRTYGTQVGEERAKQFIAEVKAVWDTASLALVHKEWLALQARWEAVSALQGVLTLIEKTLTEAMLHTKGIVHGMGRTSNVAERFFRRYKQRVARMGCFMSLDGCDNFNAAWAVYINMEPYQVRRKKHYRYPRRCPLEVGEAPMQGLTWLDMLEV
jgi:transposase-like protein